MKPTEIEFKCFGVHFNRVAATFICGRCKKYFLEINKKMRNELEYLLINCLSNLTVISVSQINGVLFEDLKLIGEMNLSYFRQEKLPVGLRFHLTD